MSTLSAPTRSARVPLSVRACLVLAAAFLVLVAVPAAARAGSTVWQSPARLGVDLDQSLQVSAANAAGVAVAIWEDYDAQGVFASYRSAAGVWGGPELVEPGGVQSGHKAAAVDASGVVTLVYRTCETCGVRARRRAVDGTWSAAVELEDFDPVGEEAGNLYERPAFPDVAVGPDGRATAVWSMQGQNTHQQVVRTSTFEDGAWTPATLLSEGLHPEGAGRVHEHRSRAQVAFDGAGRTVAVWHHAFEDIDEPLDWERNKIALQTASRAADGDAFVPGSVVAERTATETPLDVRMGVSDAGVATFAWSVLTASGSEVRARRVDAAGVQGSVVTLSAAGEGVHDHQEPAIAVAPGGDATVAWTHAPPQDPMIAVPDEALARTWAADGALGATAVVGSAVGAASRDVAASADGTVAVAWQRPVASQFEAAVRLRTPAGAWTDNAVLGGPDAQHSLNPFVALEADGDALAIWLARNGPSNDWVETMATGDPPPDVAGPQITITTPAIGQHFAEGAQVTADFACTDDVAVTTCQGTVADGAKLDTATAGSKSFTVVAEDAAGNATTRTHGYVVDAPAQQQQQTGGQTAAPFVPQAPQRYHEIRPLPVARQPAPQTPAQAALGKFSGQVVSAAKGAPKTVKASSLLGGKVDLPVKPLVPNVDVRGGLAVASGGGNLISGNGLGLLGKGIAGVVAAGGGNVVAAGGGNVVAAGGGNVVAAGGGNVVAAGGGNLLGHRAFAAAKAKAKPKLTVIARGSRFFATPKAGKLRLKVGPAGRALLRRAFRKRGRQTVKVVYLVGFTERGSGLPTVFTARELQVRE
jgi:hypothetical protein